MKCRGCTEHGWQGLVDGDGKRYHERATTPGELEVIRCVTKTTKNSRRKGK